MCKELALFGGEEVAVDGSFFKANASKDGIYTEEKLKKQLEHLDKKINDYQQALAEQDAADDKAGQGSLIEDENLPQKLELLRKKQEEKKALQEQLKNSEEKQIGTVDKDARLLSKRGQTVAGYNAQIVVDDKHKLIVAQEVTQDGNDCHQLTPILVRAQEILQSDKLTGLGDAGYYDGNQLKNCEDLGITVYVALPNKANAVATQGLFTRDQFAYDVQQDGYVCPQGHRLTPCGKPRQENNKSVMRYKKSGISVRPMSAP